MTTIAVLGAGEVGSQHELRQEQLPTSEVAEAFTHVQAPSLFRLAGPRGHRTGRRWWSPATTRTPSSW